MLLTIKSTRYPATDLGYLLHKHPAKVQSVALSAGTAHIYYPEATENACTAALLLDIDPVGLVRSKGSNSFSLDQYVNDRPYVSASFMSLAIAQAYSSAMNGRCKDKPELVDVPLPLEVQLTSLPVKGGEALLRQLFEPLGYEVTAKTALLDETFPEWGVSRYFNVTLRNTICLKYLLRQLYVLIPVCDNNKHYFVDNHEMEKLLEKGTGWLEEHPLKELITRRYLKNIGPLTNEALERLLKEEKAVEPEAASIDKKRLHDIRLEAVRDLLLTTDASTVIDLGCGEGKLLRLLKEYKSFQKLTGMDVSFMSLQLASKKLKLDQLNSTAKERITLLHGSLTYMDQRLKGYDAAVLVEVIEHLDEPRLVDLERTVFQFARPQHVIITTVNAEYNANYGNLQYGNFRHSDHRFEWTRAEFETWGNRVAEQFRYSVSYQPIGEVDENLGGPSQLAIFKRN
ncbi:3' terminal RNA ribose 2'-O-methyltransferase Hen1 [Chitinophaga silvatica]|uniref:Small RNA 2'-O-methyltransferase n=1 Tax=Chitinophaga silvatica TaxID=2282649 RepID=A0A3E1Y3F1_9BACT|nr:3' terminal RNA ribose 2'-O-methyltransferase Hen1 [Chitinophaga silvatica]RFS19203.1 3' terminal RNA ribose 2'-O-methyltransferase Hen1 [Chitinophaga silvatica]